MPKVRIQSKQVARRPRLDAPPPPAASPGAARTEAVIKALEPVLEACDADALES